MRFTSYGPYWIFSLKSNLFKFLRRIIGWPKCNDHKVLGKGALYMDFKFYVI